MMSFPVPRPFRHIAFCASLLLPFSPAVAGGNDAIVIGQVIDLSGQSSANGRDYVAGIKTCFDSVNAAGGIRGRKIVYVVRDDHGAPEVAARAASDLIEREHVDYLIGGATDDVTRAVMQAPAFMRSKQVLFAPLAGSDQLDQARVMFWRPSFDAEIQHLFAHFARLGIHSVGIAFQDTPANQAAYRKLSERIALSKLTLAGAIRIDANGAQFAKAAANLAAKKPGFVMVIADSIGTGLFLKEFRKHAAQTFVAGSSLVNLTTLLELAGPTASDWTVFSQVVPNPASGATPLQIEHLKMMRKYRDETVSSLTLEGFAAAKALVKTIEQARPGSRTVRQDVIARRAAIDLGGMLVVYSPNSNHLSSHLDIALFNKASLKF